jgi:glucosamine-6-phosphate deaminase
LTLCKLTDQVNFHFTAILYGSIIICFSQKDMVLFQDSDNREFWQRAEERNATTANIYAKPGLTRYAAMEAFVRWKY